MEIPKSLGKRAFSDRLLDVLSHFQNSIAALSSSEQLQQALYEISEQAHLVSNEETLFSSLHEIVGRFVNARNFFIALREERNGEHYVKLVYYFDELDSHLQGTEITIDAKENLTMTGFIIQSGKPILLGPDNFDRFCQENNIKYLGSKSYSLIGVPFNLDNLAGVVLVQSYSQVIYTEKDKDLLVYVARHIGDTLGRKKQLMKYAMQTRFFLSLCTIVLLILLSRRSLSPKIEFCRPVKVSQK